MQQRWLIIQHDGALIVRIERPTLTASRFVAERYSVPSAGDWSVLSRGAVELDGVTGIELRGCSWAQIGGNGGRGAQTRLTQPSHSPHTAL